MLLKCVREASRPPASAGVGSIGVLRRGGLHPVWRLGRSSRRAPPLSASWRIASSGMDLASVERVALAVAS